MHKLYFKQTILIASFFLLNYAVAFSQKVDTCKVLLKEISESYKGDCKDGLAEGKGKANGEDNYVGEFHKGLPEGQGKYTYGNGNVYTGGWKNGLKNGKGKFKYAVNGKFTTISGYWKDGEYVGTIEPEEEYSFTNVSGIETYSIKKVGDNENIIEISFEKVSKKYIPKTLAITLSSGNKIEQNLKIVIQHYSLPFYCTMNFSLPYMFGFRVCNCDFKILKPGKYEVFISNN